MKKLVKAVKKIQSTKQETDHSSSLKMSAHPFYNLELEFESDGSDTTMYVTSKSNLTKTLYAGKISESDVYNIESKMEDIEIAFYELIKELKKLGFKL